ncbi:hypothetical protein F5B22DRAFT_628502 [Xylaria bambusicola]|uniref:uncharacterized protein n=1 Tax=Xylaria bambusicola TaxID=326684 RepID=UPI002008BA9E|nr:uncharacterized protein F5B22DRAFT_628502 [Xylaria bambusicola]KAI0505182.1 hypothetical protein F5B22DRAFT_628502 [Xylaria bambusicola]
MGEVMDDDNIKAANQAWRKKPRKFAPKSRLGCKTCKIRRVKCDLSRPSCMKCKSTGRTCDGYSETLNTHKVEVASKHYLTEDVTLTSASHEPIQWPAKRLGFTLSHLNPFMILPNTEPAQTEAMYFFECVSIRHLNEYRPCTSWRKTLMYFSQTVPAVRYAAIALALVQRNHVSSNHMRHPDKPALRYYNRAIQLLLNQENASNSTEVTAITLLVCYLFTCFDHLAGNYVQAVKHLRGGVELSRNIDQCIPDKNDIYNDTQPSGVRALICQVTAQIRRLDMQAVTFLTDWTPADIQETIMSHHLPSTSAFRSLEEAADHLQVLIARVMRLRHGEHQIYPMGAIEHFPSSLKGVILAQLEGWYSLFENTLQQGLYNEPDPAMRSLITLLRLQHNTIWTFLSSSGPRREMEYDAYLPQFQQCLEMASDVAAAHERYAGSLKPTFTPEIGIVPVLYIIGAKCRHPSVRRKALEILQRQPIREAVWDSICVARVVERIIELEEGGCGETGIIESMDDIPVWQRIETLSFIHLPSEARLDVTYTFCTREEKHTEFFML